MIAVLFTLSFTPDMCNVMFTTSPIRTVIHRVTGCRWPAIPGWIIEDGAGAVIEVTDSLGEAAVDCAKEWALAELGAKTGRTPAGTWRDLSGDGYGTRCVIDTRRIKASVSRAEN